MAKRNIQGALRELRLRSDIRQLRQMLELLSMMLKEPGPLVAGLRASCARMIVMIAEELVKETG